MLLIVPAIVSEVVSHSMIITDGVEFVDNGPLECSGRIKYSLSFSDLLDELTVSMHCCRRSVSETDVRDHPLDLPSGDSRDDLCLLFLVHHLILLIFLTDPLLLLWFSFE